MDCFVANYIVIEFAGKDASVDRQLGAMQGLASMWNDYEASRASMWNDYEGD